MDKIDTLNKKLTPINKVQTNNNLLNTEKNILCHKHYSAVALKITSTGSLKKVLIQLCTF